VLKKSVMTKIWVWLLWNFICISLSVVFNNFFFLVVAACSGAFLYDEFLTSINDVRQGRMTFREQLKQYSRFQKGITPQGIILKMYIAMQMIYWSITRLELVATIETVFYFCIIIIGLSLVKSLYKDFIEFIS
jgi:hypothetical protein